MNCYHGSLNVPDGVLRVNALRTIFSDSKSGQENIFRHDWASYTKEFAKALASVQYKFVCHRHNAGHAYSGQFTLAVDLATPTFGFTRIVHPSAFGRPSTTQVRQDSRDVVKAALDALP